ncbi:MAG: ribonuclease H-like domain-containing protein [Nitrospira sp.]|nr:ribonuclease H-like domain-containing protein [Nitrospira sp.]
MLTSTFVHLKGIGPSTERRLWEDGIADWATFRREAQLIGIAPARKAAYDEELALAQDHLDLHNPRYFADCLHTRDHWRLFQTFGARALYLDIETTGLSAREGQVTIVGLHRQGHMRTLIQGHSLTQEAIQDELDQADLLITFFGTVFDMPYLQTCFPGLRVPIPHFDLCFAARRVGLQGGLKSIERELDIARESDLLQLDGLEAVRLWQRYRAGNAAALDQLIRYNAADTQNLEPLAACLYERLTLRYGPRSLGLVE